MQKETHIVDEIVKALSRKTFYYVTDPLDHFVGMYTVDEYIRKYAESYADELGFLDLLNVAMRAAKEFGIAWDGDLYQMYVFSVPDPEWQRSLHGVIWKQKNNGTTFIASPVPLFHLEETILDTRPKPPTDYQVEQLAHRTCWRYLHNPDLAGGHVYTFNRHTLLDFARALRDGGAA